MEVMQWMAIYTRLNTLSNPPQLLIPYLLVQESSQDGAGVSAGNGQRVIHPWIRNYTSYHINHFPDAHPILAGAGIQPRWS